MRVRNEKREKESMSVRVRDKYRDKKCENKKRNG